MRALVRTLSHPWAVRVAQVVIGLVIIAAGLAKVGDPRAFAEQIHNFRLVPVALENLVAMMLPWVEVVAGVALLLRIEPRAAATLTAALMAAFTLGVLQAWIRGLDIECGCFGTADASRVGLSKLAENVALTALACIASLRPATENRVDERLPAGARTENA